MKENEVVAAQRALNDLYNFKEGCLLSEMELEVVQHLLEERRRKKKLETKFGFTRESPRIKEKEVVAAQRDLDLVVCRDYHSNRVALFDGIEEGGIRTSSSYSSHEIDEHDNDRAIDGLQDRVNLLKRLTGDINEEVESHKRVLDRMGNDMDASRGILSGTMDRFKVVFETKSSWRMCSLVASFVIIFLIIYYLTR
ncbi:hypothetical protein HHK36_026872 [Tetracentron sinense]|uniref:t-SNARE coiled-coil homology domain-containing protein n=1 Tax=Tetracentron sinense TaxID=13715 RepID=A0A834YM59_TETSI|nr:hypothetical protein HHK36_026872 [Tetracentron sinense]